jgi:protein-disulfide isomerase
MSTKKEEQRRIREEKQAQAIRKQNVAGLAWKVGVAILVPLIAFVLYQGLSSNLALPDPGEIAADDHVRGAVAAPVTLTMYGDFQCPACMDEAVVFERAWSRIADKASVVFRHYPLDTHPHAFLAARYAEAAALQNRFWDMHDVLYANQQLWSATDAPAELFDGYARELGLDLEQLHADMELPAIREKILGQQRGGTRAGVRSTPSLFVNGRLVSTPRTAGELVILVNRATEEVASAVE